jgi:flavin-dependent dehydrogenase
MYDIGIVGAGPAGATLARLLADRYRILLLDSGRQKCCGGILNIKSQAALAKLGLFLPNHILATPQPRVVTIMDWDNHLVRSYARQYINIDRIAFDHWLRSLIPQTVDIRGNALYQHSETSGDEWKLHFKENGESTTAHVRWLVGADGAFSAVRRNHFPNGSMPRRYIALQHWFEQDAVSVTPQFGIDLWNDYVGIFDSSLTDFYLWTIPKSPQLILGGAFPLTVNVSSTMKIFKEKLESLGLRLGTPCKREAGQIFRPLCQSSLHFGDARTILLGEASGLIAPNSAEGISNALFSALHLAEAFQPSGFNPSLYRRLLRHRLWKLRLRRYRVPFMFNPLLRKYIMLSGLTAQRR